MAQIPECVNFVKKGGCWKSDVILERETPEAWSFRCRTCRLLFVVSKDGVRDKSQFELAAKRKKEMEEAYEARMRKKKYFVA
jgi:hypothetical protein